MNVSDHNRSSPFRRARFLVLYASLVGAGVFAALEIRTFCIDRRSPPANLPAFPGPGPSTRPGLRLVGGKPSEIVAGVVGRSGLHPLKVNPGDIPPPPEAHRISGYQDEAMQRIRRQAKYECAGAEAEVVRYYRDILTEKGFHLLRDSAASGSTRRLQFARETTIATVVLRKHPKKDKIMIVTLIVTAPESSTRQERMKGKDRCQSKLR